MTIFDDAGTYASRRISESPWSDRPFPSFSVPEQLFPESFYSLMASHWPDDKYFTRMPDHRSKTQDFLLGSSMTLLPGRERKELPHLSEDAATFWKSFADVSLEQYIFPSLMSKYNDLLKLRLGDNLDKVKYWWHVKLWNYYPGYETPAHTDAPCTLFNNIVYVPEQSSHEGCGLSLYQPKSLAYSDMGNDINNPNLCTMKYDEIEKIPYTENSLFSFFKTSNCHHGFRYTSDKPSSIRRTIMFRLRLDWQSLIALYGQELVDKLFIKRTDIDNKIVSAELKRCENATF